MRQPGASASLPSSKSKESLPPSFSFQLDLNEHPELQDGLKFLDKDDTPPQEIALPAVGPDEIALPESPSDDTTTERSQSPATPAPISTGHHSKSCSMSGSIEDHTTTSAFHVANASNSSRSSQEEEEEMEEEEDNKVIHISPESQKKLQTQLRRISKQTVAADAPKPKAVEAAPKANQKLANTTTKPQAPNRAEISSISLRDWMPTPLSPKIAEETEPVDEQQQSTRRRGGLKEVNMNIPHNEPKMIHPPRFSSYKATPDILSQAQLLEKKQSDRRMRETWLKPSDSISTLSKSAPSLYNDENKSRRISQQPIDNSILPKRQSSKGVKSNTNWQHTIENELDSIYADPTGEKRRSELEQQQMRTKMTMDAAWKAARSSSVPPVEEYSGGGKQRKSLLLPQKKELMQKKKLPTLPYSAPAHKTSFASGLEGVRNRDSQHVPSLPSMRSFRASIETPQYNARSSQYDRRINAAVENSLGYGNSKSMNSMPPATASNSTRKARPTRLDQLGPNQQSKSLTYFNSLALQTPPLTATSSASSVAGFDSVMTPRSYSHKHDMSASSMDSMSAQSVSSEGSVKPAKKQVSYLQHSKSGYSLKGDSGYGYAI